jgi:hypothetical protein
VLSGSPTASTRWGACSLSGTRGRALTYSLSIDVLVAAWWRWRRGCPLDRFRRTDLSSR